MRKTPSPGVRLLLSQASVQPSTLCEPSSSSARAPQIQHRDCFVPSRRLAPRYRNGDMGIVSCAPGPRQAGRREGGCWSRRRRRRSEDRGVSKLVIRRRPDTEFSDTGFGHQKRLHTGPAAQACHIRAFPGRRAQHRHLPDRSHHRYVAVAIAVLGRGPRRPQPGRPREVSWINATASSENKVSEWPASARWCCT